MNNATILTESQRAALKWLRDRGGRGVFGTAGVLLAAGDWAPFMRSTWNALRDATMVSIVGKTVNVTRRGDDFDCGKTHERRAIDFLGARHA